MIIEITTHTHTHTAGSDGCFRCVQQVNDLAELSVKTGGLSVPENPRTNYVHQKKVTHRNTCGSRIIAYFCLHKVRLAEIVLYVRRRGGGGLHCSKCTR